MNDGVRLVTYVFGRKQKFFAARSRSSDASQNNSRTGIPEIVVAIRTCFEPSAVATLRGRVRFPSSLRVLCCVCYPAYVAGRDRFSVIRERRRREAFDHDLCRAEVVSSLPLSSRTVKDRVRRRDHLSVIYGIFIFFFKLSTLVYFDFF